MQELVYRIGFCTPAFLGGADQQGQWRAPPFKALLRQWWRVTRNAGADGDWRQIRQDESMLFGNAWLEDERRRPLHCRSKLQLRLSEWGAGRLTTAGWQQLRFDQVETGPRTSLGADIYTGYGPVQSQAVPGRQRRMVIRNAIGVDPGKDERQLRLMLREPIIDLDEALRLMHWFGTIGSRSRNGWGSLWLVPDNEAALKAGLESALSVAERHSRPWRSCFKLDWPHAIGSDERGPLVWQSEELEHWRAAIGRLARIRVAVRAEAKHLPRGPGLKAGALHYLGYPAGTGRSNPWELPLRSRDKAELRFASPLRFKVVRSGRKVRALVFHMPSRLPDAFVGAVASAEAAWLRDERNWAATWQAVHRLLDSNSSPLDAGKPLGLIRLGQQA
jgi:CRISPR-associated protein Cmr1